MTDAGLNAGMWLLFAGSFRKNLELVLGMDRETAKATTRKAKAAYRKILAEVPPFEKKDRFQINLISCAMLGAFVLSMPQRPDVEQLFGDVRFEKENRALFEGLLSGRRFRNMKLNCYINLVEKEWETQFSAITFILDDGTLFLAFRGTDETIVGWKEDFNMAFLNPVPGQEYSVKYVNMVTG